MRFDTLLFDLDGTIIDSAPGIFRSAHQTIAEMNLPAVTDEDLRRFIGPPLKISFMRVTGCDEITAEIAATRYRELYRGGNMFLYNLYPGIATVLQQLAGDGRVMGVCTSKTEPFARQLIEHAGLEGVFRDITGGHVSGAAHAKKDLVLESLARLDADAAGTVLIGDTVFDVEAARDSGMTPLAVLWGYGRREELAAAGANLFCEHAGDLPALL